MEVEEGTSATCLELIQSIIEDEKIMLPPQVGNLSNNNSNDKCCYLNYFKAADVFTLWMTSPLLDVQLKPHHKPFYIRREWNHFLQRFSSAPIEKKSLDEPILSLQRNVFFHKRDEVKIK